MTVSGRKNMVKKLIFTLIVIAAVVFISFRLNNPGDNRVSSPAEPSFAAEVLSALEQKKAASVVVLDNATVIMESNADYSIYYMGISANQIIKTDPVVVTVTNVFDDWSTYFTGATDKSDKSAKKTWKFREVSWGSVCNMGAHGGWKYTSAGYTPESNFAWWANVTAAEAGAGFQKFM